MQINLKPLRDLQEQGILSIQQHPTLPLLIHNYTQRCQWERLWNEHTLQCRGLITDLDGNVVSRPFPKFFNLGEHTAPESLLPPINWRQEFYVSEKMDGSLAILYPTPNGYSMASRGSFVSDQARCATHLLHDLYPNSVFDQSFTYLFELIAKNNRIVVDYGDKAALILLAAIHTETGVELKDLPAIGFPCSKSYGPYVSYRELAKRHLPAGSTQDDSAKHLHHSRGMEDVPRMQESIAEAKRGEGDAGQKERAAGLFATVEQSEQIACSKAPPNKILRIQNEGRCNKESPLHGLRTNLSVVRDGPGSPARRSQAIQHQPKTWKQELEVDRGRNSEMRCRLCELPPDSDLWRKSTEPLEEVGGVREGVVVRFEDGTRIKIKLEEYCRLHKLITGVNTRHIWEYLRDGRDINELIDRVPDEFMEWVNDTVRELQSDFDELQTIARVEVQIAREDLGDAPRKDYAARFMQNPKYASLMFLELDKRDITPAIWKMLRPNMAECFATVNE